MNILPRARVRDIVVRVQGTYIVLLVPIARRVAYGSLLDKEVISVFCGDCDS
jgi:hypothetical protein